MTDASPAGSSRARLRSLVVAGVLQTFGRTIMVRAIGMVGVVFIARRLGPTEVGIVALAATVQSLGHILADAGLGSGLIQRALPPTRAELSGLLAAQLAITALMGIIATIVALTIGGDVLEAVAIAVWSLPLYATRTPYAVVADRALRFGPEAYAAIVESIVFTGLSIVVVAAGGGARSVVIATVIGAAAGTVTLVATLRIGVVVPRPSVAVIRSLWGFAARFQAGQMLEVARAQVLTAGVLAIGGLRIVGFNGTAERVWQLPLTFLAPVMRVAFPAFSRLVEIADDADAVAVRGTRLLTVALGLIVAPLLATTAVLVPLIFGAPFAPAAGIILGGALGLVVGSPTAIVVVSLFYARGEVSSVLRAQAVLACVSTAVSLSLLALIGPAGIGIGWLAGNVLELCLFDRLMRRASAPSPLKAVWSVIAWCCVSGLAGRLVADHLATGWTAVVAGGTTSGLVFLIGVSLVVPDERRRVTDAVGRRLRTTSASRAA